MNIYILSLSLYVLKKIYSRPKKIVYIWFYYYICTDLFLKNQRVNEKHIQTDVSVFTRNEFPYLIWNIDKVKKRTFCVQWKWTMKKKCSHAKANTNIYNNIADLLGVSKLKSRNRMKWKENVVKTNKRSCVYDTSYILTQKQQ